MKKSTSRELRAALLGDSVLGEARHACGTGWAIAVRFGVPILAAVFGAWQPGMALTYEVDRFDDPFPDQVCDNVIPNDCSLRDALLAANLDSGPDIISLPAGHYYLTRSGDDDAALVGDLDITEAVSIQGADQDLTIIDGGGAGGLDDRIIEVRTASSVELQDLTLRGGYTTAAGGGGIHNLGNVTLRRTTVVANESLAYAGGILNSRSLELVDSTVTDNRAPRGGGIDTNDTLVLENSWVTLNEATCGAGFGGAGILHFGGTMTLTNSVVSDNVTNGDCRGGGILVQAGGSAELFDSRVSGNTAPGHGGGLSIELGEAALYRSTVSGNTAGGNGGGIYLENYAPFASALLYNSTVSGNHATDWAGAIFKGVDAHLELHHSTIHSNSAGEEITVTLQTGGTASAHASIIQGPCQLSFSSTSDSIETPGDTCGVGASGQANVSAAALQLGSLAALGGPTLTHLPLPGSVAIDTGPTNSGCPPPADDQRGMPRAVDGDGAGGAVCDVGAVERQPGDPFFYDGFESGDTSAWSSTVQ